MRTLCGTILAAVAIGAAVAADGQSDASRMGAEVMNPRGALRCVERTDGGDFRVLIYGNSIALHGPKPDIGWTNCWGMAASSAEKDFAHLVVAGLEKRLGKKADFRIRNLAVLERNFMTNIATVAEIAADTVWKPDYVVVAIGENAPNIDKSNAAAYRKFLADIARPFVKNRAKVVMRSPFWRNPAKASCTASAAAEVGAAYVDAGHLGEKDENKAIGLFSHGGVANHPGDLGMKLLADLILGGFNAATENLAEEAKDRFAGRALKVDRCRVTDSVNADRRPVRIPKGAGEFQVERPRAHGGAVVNAADFGFSTTNDLNASAIMRALDFCRTAGASRLVLAPGTYNCFDPDHGLVVADMEDFTLDGVGATLVFRRPARRLAANSIRVPHDSSVLVTNCQRCVVGNFSIDWDWKSDPLCDVGVVTATHVDGADNESHFDLAFPDWPQGHPWYGRPMPIQTMTPINAERTRLTGEDPSRLLFGLTEGHFGTKMKWLSPNSIRVWPCVREPGQYAAPVNDHYYGVGINRQTASNMRKGVNYRVFHYYYGKNGITVHSGRHVTVENVNVLSCFGMPIVVDGSLEYGEFRKIVVEPVQGRPCTGTSDGCHIARSKGHIKFIDCVISFQNDDGLNIHDCFTLGVPDGSRRIRVANARGPEYLGAQPGNELELLAPNFRPLGWKGRLVATEGECFVVDRDLPPLEGEHFLVFDNTFQSDHIVLRGCIFHDTHLREIVQPKHVTVENCAFIRTGSGFKMGSAHSREFWCEGRGSRGVVIRGCVFEYDSTLADWWGCAMPVFETYVRFPKPRPYPPGNDVFTSIQPEGFDIAFHGDILVEKCRITDPAGPLFIGNPVSNLIFRDNEIVLTGTRRLRGETGSFVFGSARDVFITGNRYAVPQSVGEFEPFVKGCVPGLVVHSNTICVADESVVARTPGKTRLGKNYLCR